MKNIACAVLAAGMSRRMGKENKLLLPINGKPLYQHICCALPDDCLKIIVTAFPEIASYAAEHGFAVVGNDEQCLGQSHSIKLALQKLEHRGENNQAIKGILFATADQPFITPAVINTLYDNFQQQFCNKIIVPAYKNKAGSPCIFPVKYKDELMRLTGDRGGRAVYKKHLDDVIFVQLSSELPLLDVDTPADLQCVKQYDIR